MKTILQLTAGLFSALAMVLIVFGALLLSISEEPSFAAAVITQPSPVNHSGSTATSIPTEMVSPITPPPGITLVIEYPSPTVLPTLAGATRCPPPPGWQPYIVAAEDQVDGLAAQFGVSVPALMQANCLISASLLPGSILYLPVIPTAQASLTPQPTSTTQYASATATPRPACGPFTGWVLYTVQPNDTLYKLSQAFGVSVYQLQQANCLAGTLIQVGTRIYVPNVPTRTPERTNTPRPTLSSTMPAPSATHSATHTPAPTDTIAPTVETPVVTPSDLPTATPTDTPSLPPVITDTPTGTLPAPVVP